MPFSQNIEQGRLQIFCVDSVDGKLRNRGIHPHDRVMRHISYESYLLYEVLPLIRRSEWIASRYGLAGAASAPTTRSISP